MIAKPSAVEIPTLWIRCGCLLENRPSGYPRTRVVLSTRTALRTERQEPLLIWTRAVRVAHSPSASLRTPLCSWGGFACTENHSSSRNVKAISNRVAAWDTWSCS
jgi:hypothetical protein